MATGTAYFAVNMNDPEIFDVEALTISTGERIQASGFDGELQDFFGSGFDYDATGDIPEVTAGTITRTEYREGDALIFRINALGHSAVEVYQYFLANDNQGLLAYAFGGADTMNGSSQADTINGYAGADAIKGNAGNDKLNGGTGADKLWGGAGKDSLLGGSGADKFVFDAAPSAASADTIRDFSHAQGDRILLDGADFAALGASLALGEFRAFTNISASGGAKTENQHILYDTDSGNLYYDADGSLAAHAPVLIATLSTKPVLAIDDFQVI